MNKKQLKKRAGKAASHIFALLVFAYLYIPVIIMVIFSFNNIARKTDINQKWAGFTTRWYGELFRDAELWRITALTIAIAVASTLITTFIGTLGAVGLKKWDFKLKKAITSSLYIPIVIPEIVLAVALMLILKAVGISLGAVPMVIGMVTLTIPYVFITVKTRLVGMDPSLEEASLDLGANKLYTFIHITLPSVMPGIVSGGFLAFTLALGDLIILNFLSDVKTVTLSVKIYSMVKKSISPEINALASLILGALLLILVILGVSAALKKALGGKKSAQAGRAAA